jgi:hypothetical protein
MAEIIELATILRARARRREQELNARCVGILEDCLEASRCAYGQAPLAERPVRAAKIRQLEDLIVYASNLA